MVKPAPGAIRFDNAADLVWFFGETIFARSTFGDHLERAQVRAFDHTGKRIKPPPLWEYDSKGRIVGQRQYIHVGGGRKGWKGQDHDYDEPVSYEPEHQELIRYGRINARMRAVARLSRSAVKVLSVYYGNAGARWSVTDLGRVWSLAPLTKAGLAALENPALKSQLIVHGGELAADELLAREVQSGKLMSPAERRRLQKTIIAEAEALALEAGKVWNLAAELPAED